MTGLVAVIYRTIGTYAVFFVTILYAIGFVGNFARPQVDRFGFARPLVEALSSTGAARAVRRATQRDGAPGFKRWWTRFVPHVGGAQHVRAVREPALLLLYWQWRPMPTADLDGRNPTAAAALHAMFWLGWALVLASTFLINHFELFGLQPGVRAAARPGSAGAEIPDPAPVSLRAPSDLSRLPARVLGHAGDDRRPPAVRDGDHGLHPDRHPLRGARPDRACSATSIAATASAFRC